MFSYRLRGGRGLDFSKQPGTGVRPVILGGARRDTEHFRRFVIRHPHEVAEFHQFRFDLVFGTNREGRGIIVKGMKPDVISLTIIPLTEFGSRGPRFDR